MDLGSLLRKLLGLEGKDLVQSEQVIEPYRYVPFEPRPPSAIGEADWQASQPDRPRQIPGTLMLDILRRSAYASDDPDQVGAMLEAWKDQRRLKDKLSR